MKRLVCILLFGLLLMPLAAREHEVKSRGKNTPTISVSEQRKFDYYFHKGAFARINGQYDVALECYQHCVDINAKSAALHYELGLLFTATKDYVAAYAESTLADQLEPNNDNYQNQLLAYHLGFKENEKAIALCKKLSAENPTKKRYIEHLITLYESEERWKDALAQYDRLESIDGVQIETTGKKVRIMYDQHMKGIEKELKRLVAAHPENTDCQIYVANYYVEEKRYAEAEKIYKTVLAHSPTDDYAINQLASFYNTIGNVAKEDSVLWAAVRNEGLTIQSRVRFGCFLARDSQEEVMDSVMAVIREKNEENVDFQEAYMDWLEEKEDSAEALVYAKKIVEKDPYRDHPWFILSFFSPDSLRETYCLQAFGYTNHSVYGLYLARYYMYGLNEKEKAYEMICRTTEARVKDAEALATIYAVKGDFAHKLGLKEECYEAYDTALMYNSKSSYVMNNYAYFLALDSMNLKYAEEMSAKSIEMDPTNAFNLGTYAWILYLRGDYLSAKFYVEKAISYDKEQFILYAQYGDILLKRGQKAEAVKAWKRAIELYEEGKDDPSESKESVLEKIKLYSDEEQ